VKTRMIQTKFWFDDYVSNLKAKEKLLFVYLITNEKVNICGIYEIPDKYIILDTGLRQKELDLIKQKFMDDGKFAFINGWVKVMNYDRYNNFSGSLNEVAREKELSLIPQEIIDFQYNQPNTKSIKGVSKGYRRGIDTLNNHNININHNKSLINSIISYLNEKADKNYKSNTKTTIDKIKARINEGFTIGDFKKVIDTKVAKWKTDPKMNEFLRPETLFGNKFDGYLNEKIVNKDDWRRT